MPRQSKTERTPLQEKILITMAYLTCTVGEGDSWYSEQAIRRIIGGQWTKYRREEMARLVTSGWLERTVFRYVDGERFYRLTNAALTNLAEAHTVRKHEVIQDGQLKAFIIND